MSPTTQRIRYGIVGFGGFAEKAILPAFQHSATAVVTAIHRRSASVARATADQHGIAEAYGSVGELAESPDVDAVFVASANGSHRSDTIEAARAGKHVIVEKPMAISVRECEEMINECARAGVKLMVAHMIRFSPLAARIRQIIRSDRLGRIAFARADFVYDARLTRRNWLLDRAMAGGGPVYDVGVHCLDTLRFVLDDEVTDVAATLEPLPTPNTTEEVASLSLRFSKGTIGSIVCSYRSPVRSRAIEIVGEEGMLSAPDFTVSDIVVPLTVQLGTDTEPGSRSVEEIAVPNLYIAEIDHFSGCILTGSEPLTPGSNGLANQVVLERALAVRA